MSFSFQENVMQTEIHISHSLNASEGLREHIDRRLGYALGRFGERISRVSVHISDENGPRGGVDTRCKMHVTLRPHGTLHIEQDDSNAETAVEVASMRLGQAIRRELERQRTARET